MPHHHLAIASAKSFGDFVIAHSILNSVSEGARHRIRLIACSHVEPLNAVLPGTVDVTLVNSGSQNVPALFDMRKCGMLAAARSALSLRREFDRLKRNRNEALAFDRLGIRERFIAGDWHLTKPRHKRSNVYDTYLQLLREHEIRTTPPPPESTTMARSVGIFPESRLARKRLDAASLAIISERAKSAGLAAQVFVLAGDEISAPPGARTTSIARNFPSLTEAIRSVDKIVSADSLPAHLGEYLGRPVFVACPAPNEYWLPHRCFREKRWGNFNHPAQFTASLDEFLGVRAAGRLQ